MPSREIDIGGRRVGGARDSVYFIAEAGSNHDRNLDQAKRLVDVAVSAGADAVKFQTFRAEHLYPRSAGQTDYLQTPRSIFDVIRDLEMPIEWIPILARYCADQGIHFLSTPFDEKSADALEPHVPAFKIASYEMTHYGLVQHVARKGKPVIVSTGTANLAEVRELVAAVRAVGCEDLVLLQCTAKYPAPLDAVNVRVLSTFAAEFGVPVGLSDHSREPLPAPLAAVALGAAVIEKHFTLSNSLPGPDHAYALEPHELADVIRNVRAASQALGSAAKDVHPVEQELRSFARRSIFAVRALPADDRIRRGNTAVLRCGKLAAGFHPGHFTSLLGRTVKRAIPAETALVESDLGPLELGCASVSLRRLSADDTEAIVRWRGRPDVAHELFSERAPTRREHEDWLAALALRSDRMEFVIVDRQLGPVGTVGLSAIDFGKDEAEYGIMLGEPAARGRGLATLASIAILDHAFDNLGLTRVTLRVFSDNDRARRLYDRLGFALAATQPPPRTKGGVMRPVTEMVLTAEGWRVARDRNRSRFEKGQTE